MNKPTKNKYSLLTSLPFSVFIFCLLACVVPESNAQTTKRIEFPVVNNDAPYRVIPLGAKGVLVANRGLKNNFILNKLNGDFERDWGVEVQLEDGFELVATDYDGQSVFLLFGGGKNEYYQVVKVNVGPGFIENFFLQVLDKFQITEFKTLGYSVFLAGMVRDEPVFVSPGPQIQPHGLGRSSRRSRNQGPPQNVYRGYAGQNCAKHQKVQLLKSGIYLGRNRQGKF